MFTTLSVTTASVTDSPCGPLPPAPATDPSAPLCLFVSFASPTAGPDSPGPPTPLAFAPPFAQVPAPRHRAFRDHHRLDDILVLALTAVLCGAKSWEAIADFGRTKEAWFRSLGLLLPNGIPSHDTF